LSKVEIDLIN